MTEPAVVVEARCALGRQLAAFRRAAGLNQQQLAERLHYGRSTVANVETGRQHGSRRFWQQCDEITTAAGALIRAYDDLSNLRRRQQWDEASALAAPHRQLSVRPADGTDTAMTGRRDVTKLIATLAAGAVLGGVAHDFDGDRLERSAADPATLAGHLTLIDHLAGMYRAVDPLPILPAVAGYADRLLQHLDHGGIPAAVAFRLAPAVVGLHAQVGLWACHTDQPAVARRYLAVACELADDTDDPALQARALGALSYRYSSAPRGGQGGNPQRALRLLDAALAKATMADAFTRGWLATWRADQHMTLGNVDQARRDIAFARTALDRSDDGGLTGFFAIDAYGYGMRGHLDSVHATVTALTGQHTHAEQAFAAVHAAAANMRRRIATLGHQAFAHVAAGDPEAASAALTRSVTLAVAEHYGMGLRRAIGVRAAFAPAWAPLPAVRNLDEHLTLATAG